MRYLIRLLFVFAFISAVFLFDSRHAQAAPASVTVAANPGSIKPGQAETLDATLAANSALSNYTLVFTVKAGGRLVAVRSFPNLNVAAGNAITETFSWLVPAGARPGNYTITVEAVGPRGNVRARARARFTVTRPATANAVCGPADGVAVSLAPVSGLCTTGTASRVR